MKKKIKKSAGERMIASAKQALAFATGEKNHGCVVHIPEEINVKAIREKVDMSQSEFSRMFESCVCFVSDLPNSTNSFGHDTDSIFVTSL